MKKVLAMLLSVAMVLSVAGMMTLSTSAMGENENYPLLYETYETPEARDYVDDPIASRGTITITEPGVNGSQSALHVHQTSAGNYIDVKYPMSGKIPKGQELEISYWIKLNSELKADVTDANRISLIFYGSGTVTNIGKHEGIAVGDEWTGSGWKQYDVSNKLVTGQWVKIDQSITWQDAMSIGNSGAIDNISLRNVALRVANLNGTNAVVDGAPLDYEIDDFIIRYPAPEQDEEEEISSILYENDFDTETTSGELDGRSEDCSEGYKQVVLTADLVNPDLGYIKDKQANLPSVSVNPQVGRLYKFSGWYRFDADETATDFEVTKANVRLILYGKDRNDANFLKGKNYPSYYSKDIPVGEWTKVEYYFYMDFRMYTKNPGAYMGMRICPYASYKGGKADYVRDHGVPGTYRFDNIVIEDLGSPANNDFELPYMDTVRNFEDSDSLVPGWYTHKNADGLMVTELDGNTYLHYTALAERGNFQTAFPFEHGTTYTISFRARTEGLEEGETKPLTLILDRKVTETGSGDSYTVPNYEYLIGDGKEGGATAGADHPWQISNEWQTFTTTYTTDSKVIAGMESTAVEVNPRAAMMYFFVDSTSPAGTVFCLDDLKIEAGETISNFTVDNISFKREGSSIRVNYDFIPFNGETENKAATLIRAFIKNADGTETNIGTFSAEESFDIPKLAIGKQITYEVIPVDTNGRIGDAKSAVCEDIFDFSMTKKLEVSSDYTEASYHFSFISAKGETLHYVAAMAAYNGAGKLLDVLYDAVDIEDGESDFSNTLPLPEQTEKVKLMLLDAKSLAPQMMPEEKVLPAINDDPFAGDDEINVVFLGDSIYAGSGASTVDNRWVTKVGNWFKETYEDEDTKVNWYNKGVGGTTSHYSLVRMKRDVLDLNPDMVFVTMTPNDSGDTSREMESVIRTLQELDNPPYIVKTFFTNRNWRVSPGYGDKVAAHYGIPVYNNIEDMKEDIAATGRAIEDYFADSTHPNNAGYEVIANGMIDFLSTNRHYAKPYNAEKLVDNAVILKDATFINAEDEAEVTREGSWVAGDNYLQSSAEGDSLMFYFTGNFIAFEHGLHKNSGRYEVYVDDELVLTGNPRYNDAITSFQKVCKGDSTNLDLSDGEHVVEIKTVASAANVAPEDYVLRLYDIIVGTLER